MANWRRTIGWAAVGIGVLLVVAVVGALVLLKSSAFQHYLISKIERTAGESLGSNVEIQNLQIHPKTLTADVYGLTLHGTEPAGAKPLLQVQHARVGLRIISIVRRNVNLSEVLIERPVLNLVVNKEGQSNLPHPPASQNKSGTNVFDLAVGHVLLTDGEINAHDQTIPVDANLNDLRTEITFSQLQKKYSGRISYQNGLIHYENLRPLPHSLQASFDATPSELNLRPLLLNLGGSRFSLEATVHDYSTSPVADARYNIALHTQDFAGLSNTAQTAGDVVLHGTINYKDLVGQPMLRDVTLVGDIGSEGLAISSPQAVLKIQRIAGSYQLANGNFKTDGFTVDVFNGRLTATGTIEQVDSARRSRFHMRLADISLQAIKSSLRNFSNQSIPVAGTLNASADANWQGAFEKLRANSAVTMHGAVVASNKSQTQQFPLNADVRLNYDAPRKLVTVPASSIQFPATVVRVQGTVGDHSNLTVKGSSSDLHQLMMLATAMPSSGNRTTTSASQNESTQGYGNIRGAATLNALIRGTLQNPQITAQLSATKLQVNKSEWNSLQLALSVSPSEFVIQNARLVSARQGQLSLNARVGLQRWSYLPSDPIAANLQIQQLSAAELEDVANAQYPVEGQIAGNIQLSGSELNPAGQGEIQLNKAKISDEPLKTVSAEFRAANGTVASKLTLGAMVADVSYTPKTKAYNLKLQTSQIDVSKSHTVQAKNLSLKGLVMVAANGSGTIDDPELTAKVQIDQLQLRDTTFSRVTADLNVANHLAKLALSSGVGGAAFRGDATVHLTPGYYTEASLDTSKFAVDPLLAMYVPSRPAGLRAETEVHLSLSGPAADKSKIEAHLTIPVLNASYQSLQIAAAAPIRADYSNSLLVLQPATLKGTDTSLQFQARVPVGKPETMAVSAHGSVALRLIQMFSPDLRTGGDIALDVNAAGSLKNPSVSGQVRLQNISFATEEMPLGVQNLNALVQVNSTGLQITNGSGQLGGGDLTLGGSLTYRPQLQMNLALSAKSVRLRYPEGMRTVFDCDLTLSGNQQASLLQGRVLIDSLSFTSDFDISSFMSQFTGTSAPPTGQGMTDNLKLQIAVQSTSQLNAGTAQLGIEGSANLRVIGTASEPVVIGRADLTSGDIFFDKNQYHLERGIITFANPNQTEPVLNMLITTTINQYALSVTIRGPIEKLQTTYVSDPPLPPIDIINLIARGQTTSEGAPASFGANQVLAAGLGQVSGEVTKLSGIAGLQIDPLVGGENNNPSARVGIQKRVTKNFTFTFSTDVTQPQSEIVQGDYQLTKRWSVSVSRNESGGVAVDGRLHTNF